MIIYEPPHAATEIPVIDLADSYSDDIEKRKKVAWEIHKACVDTGFFYIKNHTADFAVMHDEVSYFTSNHLKVSLRFGRSQHL